LSILQPCLNFLGTLKLGTLKLGTPKLSETPQEAMAGAEGFEPPLAVLETAGLPLNLRPYNSAARRQLPVYPIRYLISLCGICLRQKGQNFFISRRSVVVFLFFMLV
jgi:hypothetical protein